VPLNSGSQFDFIMFTQDLHKLPQILYIEDSDESRSLVRRLLSNRYVILEASEPLGGLQLAEETHPDLILLDEGLPRMSGSEAAARLHQLLPDTPIVILSADTTAGARGRALASGAVGFISKPIDDGFADQCEAYLGGKVDILEDAEGHLRSFQQDLVQRLEESIRQLNSTVEKNKHLFQQNQSMVSMLERRHKLLETSARVGQMVTSILDLDDLLKYTVNIICSEFGLYYSGIFLISDDGQWAVLRSGYALPGRKMLAENFRLPVDNKSMIGNSILSQQAQIALGSSKDNIRFKNPFLPNTRSEIALPLVFKSQSLGAVTVQSDEVNAFTEEDITSMQMMADQIAIAINNARSKQELEDASAELLRTKTYEAIATATGEAIHWVGNKAAPIPGSVKRVREDMLYLIALAARVDAPDAENESIKAAIQTVKEEAEAKGIDLKQIVAKMSVMKANQLKALVSVDSLFEDLDIVENSAVTILDIKEGLIGPARQRKDESISLRDLISNTAVNMDLPGGVLEMEWAEEMPKVHVDARQVEQVFNNLIKNAWEAVSQSVDPKIQVKGRRADDPDFVQVTVKDNGPGIPKEMQEKIWVSFFTTKGSSGGTGLGLSSVMQIVNQHGGSISLESDTGMGALFTVRLPAEKK
jgi:signal transduction histidine kinase/DNA-binding NarL/FixJ family response regulator